MNKKRDKLRPFEWRENPLRLHELYKKCTLDPGRVYRTHLKISIRHYMEYLNRLPQTVKETIPTGGKKSLLGRGSEGELFIRRDQYDKLMRLSQKGRFNMYPGMFFNRTLSEVEKTLARHCDGVKKLITNRKETGVNDREAKANQAKESQTKERQSMAEATQEEE